jgi:hypothetical protein
VHLLDKEEQPIRTVETETDQELCLNGYFRTDDGELWLIAEVLEGDGFKNAEITAIRIGDSEPGPEDG